MRDFNGASIKPPPSARPSICVCGFNALLIMPFSWRLLAVWRHSLLIITLWPSHVGVYEKKINCSHRALSYSLWPPRYLRHGVGGRNHKYHTFDLQVVDIFAKLHISRKFIIHNLRN